MAEEGHIGLAEALSASVGQGIDRGFQKPLVFSVLINRSNRKDISFLQGQGGGQALEKQFLQVKIGNVVQDCP